MTPGELRPEVKREIYRVCTEDAGDLEVVLAAMLAWVRERGE